MSSIEWNNSVSFTVPLTPPSVNHYKVPVWSKPRAYQPRKLGFRLTDEAKAFRDAVVIFAKQMTVIPDDILELIRKKRKVAYRVEIDVWLGKGQRLDADNAGKICLDALENAGVIHSDAYVETCVLNIHKDERNDPRTKFFAARLED